jgi:glycosyltransferase involved in cell wall biosynthesis
MTQRRILYHHRVRADDGQAVHVRELIGALRAQGHEVLECALVQKAAGGAPAGAERPPRRRAAFWQRLSLPRVALEGLEVLYGRVGAGRLRAAARSFRPDFVYERHALHCDSGLRAARALGIPLVLEVNSPMCDEMKRLGLLRFEALARRTEKRVLGGADAVLPVTKALAGILEGCGAPRARMRVIGNGADPLRTPPPTDAERAAARGSLGLPEDALAVGFVGFMREWHRLDLVVMAMQRPALQRVHLVLVGEGPALAPTLAAAQAHGVGPRVHAPGRLSGAAFVDAVRGFDAALIPAINEYASPLKLFDSLAAAVVTLAPRQANLLELIEDGQDGLLFTPGDAASLAERLEFLAADRDRARRIGRAGRDKLVSRDWTWAGNARRVIDVYEGIVR